MPSSVEQSTSFETLAAERRWPEVAIRLQAEQNGSAVLQCSGLLKDIGAECAAAKSWADAAVCYRLAQWPVYHGASVEFPMEQLQDFYLTFAELVTKAQEAVEKGASEGTEFWTAITNAAIGLANSGLADEAEQVLMWLLNSDNREWAGAVERAASTMPIPEKAESALWLFRQARQGYGTYASLDPAKKDHWMEESERLRDKVLALEEQIEGKDEQPEAAVEESETEEAPSIPSDAFDRLAELTRIRDYDERSDLLNDEYSPFREQIVGHFEAEGDRLRELGKGGAALDAYSVAIAASSGSREHLLTVVREIQKSDWDYKLDTPVPEEAIPEPLGWENGLDRVVWLALRGRTEDADDLLLHLRRVLREPEGMPCIPTGEEYMEASYWFQEIARHIKPAHQHTAEWFQDRCDYNLFEFDKRPAAGDPNRSVAPLLQQMESWLAENREDYFANLQPGVTPAQLDQFETEFRLKLPPAFRQLYQWRNGQKIDCYESLVENRMFMSLEDIADAKRCLDPMIGMDFTDPTHWRRGWVPFLSNGGGDYLCVDITAKDGGSSGQIREYWHADDDRDVPHDDLREWLTYLVESMEDGSLD